MFSNRFLSSFFSIAAVVMFTPIAAIAAPVTIDNFDFEEAGLADGAITANTPPGWTSNNATDYSFNPNGTQPQYNNLGLDDTGGTGGMIGTMSGPTFSGMFSTGVPGVFSQMIPAGLAANTTHVLTVAVGRRDVNFAKDASPFTFELRAGNTVLDSISGDPDTLFGSSTFGDVSFTFVSGEVHPNLGDQLEIVLNKQAEGDYFDIDNVRFDMTPPPPSSWPWIAITNHDFEDTGLADGGINAAAPPGWTSNNVGDLSFNPNGTQPQYNNTELDDSGGTGGELGTMDGPTFGSIFDGVGDRSGAFSQVLSENLAANKEYTLTMAVGRRDVNFSQDASPFSLELWAGGILLDSVSGDPDDVLASSTFGDAEFTFSSDNSHPALGEPLEIILRKQDAGDYFDVDNVRLLAVDVFGPDLFPVPGDGYVDGDDLGVLLANWGPVDADNPADLFPAGGNLIVDGDDLGVLLANWTGSPPITAGDGAAVPEPATALLALLGLIALVPFARRK